MRRAGCLLATGFGLLAVLGLFGALPARAAGVVGNGTPQSCTAAALVSAMAGGGVVTFNCGALPHTIAVTESLGIIPPDHTTLDGGGLITLNGNHTNRLFSVGPNTHLTLTEITLANGYMNAPGGAIDNQGRTVLDAVTIRDSFVTTSTWGGGAIYNAASATLVVRNSILRKNASGGGGAIYNALGGRLLIENSQFISNTAYGVYGGAITNVGVMTITGGLLTGNALIGPYSFDYGGGAVANLSTAQARSTDVIYSHNSASSVGGAIFTQGVYTIDGGLVTENTAFSGGGLFKNDNASASLSVINAVISLNEAANDGGGIYQDRGNINVTGAIIYENTASDEGGGIFLGYGTINVSGSLIGGNEAADGGGIAGTRANINLYETTVSGNSASADGGGVLGYTNTDISLDRSTVSGNTAGGRGGGLYNIGGLGTLTLVNSTVSGNGAATGGGLYQNTQTSGSLWNVTLAENSAAIGGGLFVTTGVTMTLTNSLVVISPAGGDCGGAGTIVAQHSLASDATCALPPGNNQNSTDPLLTPLGDFGGPTQVHLPKLGSPAINGVVGSNAPAFDQRGELRPQGGGYDIGAVERQPGDVELALSLFLPLVVR